VAQGCLFDSVASFTASTVPSQVYLAAIKWVRWLLRLARLRMSIWRVVRQQSRRGVAEHEKARVRVAARASEALIIPREGRSMRLCCESAGAVKSAC
jgi:hypothetical protein